MIIRTCIVTRQKKSKNELVRIGIEDGKIEVGAKRGRGVYLLPDIKVFEEAIKRNAISRGLKLNRKLTIEEIEEIRDKFILVCERNSRG